MEFIRSQRIILRKVVTNGRQGYEGCHGKRIS